MKNILKVVNMSKNLPTKLQKPGNQVNFHAPGSGSAFPIRIRIQDSQMNKDPDPQHWFCH
jgi:hypothetical protein